MDEQYDQASDLPSSTGITSMPGKERLSLCTWRLIDGGFFRKLGLVAASITALLVLVLFYGISGNAPDDKRAAESLQSSESSNISPAGDVARIFAIGTTHTEVQRDNKERELVGKTVRWNLPVYDVSRVGGVYRISTQGFCSSNKKRIYSLN